MQSANRNQDNFHVNVFQQIDVLRFQSPAYQEESIDDNVKEERREHVARVVIVPHADLDRDDHGCVDE
jgi:hypothetical protein